MLSSLLREQLTQCNLADTKYEVVKLGKAGSVSMMVIYILDHFHISLVLDAAVLVFLRLKRLFPVSWYKKINYYNVQFGNFIQIISGVLILIIRFVDIFCGLKLTCFVRQLIRDIFILQLFVLVMFHCLNHKIGYMHSLLFLNRMWWIVRMLEPHSGSIFWATLHWYNIIWHVEDGQMSGTEINVNLVKNC